MLFSALVIFLIGDERRLFSSSVEFKTKFADVQGLKSGAPIRMGGLDIGHVSGVGYGKDPSDATIYVELSVVRSEAQRIKIDSKAKVATKGLLGDKMIEITKGTAAKPVEKGAWLPSEEPEDTFGKVGGIAGKAEATLDGAQKVVENLANEQLHK